jgi:hypothetical protein
MRLVEEKRMVLIGVLLVSILLLNLAQQFVGSKQSSNNQAQVRQSLELVESYGRVNAFALEYIEMLNYDMLFSRNPEFWTKNLKDVPEVLNKIPEAERYNWQDKTTRERFMYKARELNEELKKCQQKANILFQSQEDFISKNQAWGYVETTLQMIQVAIILLVIYLYAGLLSSIHGRIAKSK